MGIFDRIKRIITRKKVRYFLFREGGRGKRQKIAEFDHVPSQDEVLPYIQEEGTYAVQEFVDGRWGKIIWKQLFVDQSRFSDDNEDMEIEIDEIEIPKRRKRRNNIQNTDPLDALVQFAEMMEQQQEKFEKLAKVGVWLAKLGGQNIVVLPPGKSVEDFFLEGLKQLQQKYQKYAEVFGGKVQSDIAELPIEGKIPATLVYAPYVLNQMFDTIESRLHRWGLLEELGQTQQPKRQIQQEDDFPSIEKFIQKKRKKPAVEVIKEKPKTQEEISNKEIERFLFEDEGFKEDKIDKIEITPKRRFIIEEDE